MIKDCITDIFQWILQNFYFKNTFFYRTPIYIYHHKIQHAYILFKYFWIAYFISITKYQVIIILDQNFISVLQLVTQSVNWVSNSKVKKQEFKFRVSNSKWNFLFFSSELVTRKRKNKSLPNELVTQTKIFLFSATS